VKRRIDDGDEAHPTQWTYDVDGSGQPKLGRLTQMVGPTGIRTDLAYEDSPRALGTSITRQVGDEVFTTTTSFDRLGLPIRTEYPSVPRAGADDFAFAVRPIFDPHSGALVAVQSDDATTDYWRISGADEMGRVTEVALGNGLHETYEFDPTSQLLARASVLDEGDHELSSLDYSYFDNGQLHERTLSAGGLARARTIAYDNARRIHTVTESGSNAVNETFNFSPSGRLESRTKFGEYTYDEQHPHALGSVAENEFTYDERGNQKTREGPNVPGGAQTISYNRFNLPSRVAFGIDPEHADRTIDFEYDADGNRIVKREANGGPEVLSLGDEYERTTGGVSAPGVQHKFRIFAAGREVAQVIYDEALAVPEVRYLHRDQQMSVLLTTNADGEANEVRDFDVFGEAVTTPGWADTTKEGFTGHQREVDIGLVSAGARLYDATFGVFISADPLRESFAGSQSFNPYAYTNNDPVNLIDPTGLAAEEPNWWDNPGTWSCPGNGCMCRDPGCGGPQIGYRKIRDTPVNEFIATGGQGEWGGTMTAAELANMPSGLQAPPLRTPNLFAQPEFQVVDTSETLRTELNIAMGVVNLCQLAGTAVAWVSARVFIAEASEILAAEGATLAEGTAVAAEGAATLESSAIRFSQSSVNGVEEIAASMRANGWVGAPVDVVSVEGRLITVDNTRVLAASMTNTPVQAVVHGAGEALPASMAGRFGAATTWGEAVVARIAGQNAAYRAANPLGSWFIGATP
jgi:RHS repeat-associated protein